MPYGIYLSAAGADVQSQRMEVLANNLANVNTAGFKRDFAVFQARHAEAIQQGHDYPGSRSINDVGGGVFTRDTLTDYSAGTVQPTGIPTDLTIDGDGYFVVAKEGQEYLTRAGNFTFTALGELVTQRGDPVMGDGGPVTINPALPWEITGNGSVRQAGTEVALAIRRPAFIGDLVKMGENLFSPLSPPVDVPAGQRRVRQGYLELSNVKPTREMMELIETSRAFEANTRLIQNQDHVMGALINRVLRQA